ncbi:hypothetical protein PYCC9005_001616 [Savitreella phatthalungensis]
MAPTNDSNVGRDKADIIYDITRVLFRPRAVMATLSPEIAAQIDDPEGRAALVEAGADAGSGRSFGLSKEEIHELLEVFRKERINPTALAEAYAAELKKTEGTA